MHSCIVLIKFRGATRLVRWSLLIIGTVFQYIVSFSRRYPSLSSSETIRERCIFVAQAAQIPRSCNSGVLCPPSPDLPETIRKESNVLVTVVGAPH